MNKYEEVTKELSRTQHRWLVTGGAGFIGSHLIESLLKLDQQVVAVDNFVTGDEANIANVLDEVTMSQRGNFEFIELDVCDQKGLASAMQGCDYVLHQAALGSVPRSFENPLDSNKANIEGFLSVLLEAGRSSVKRFVFASSSATYGDSPTLPKKEDLIGRQMSPYAVTKYAHELYAQVIAESSEISCVGLRYFNVFGPRQDPDGPYAAVIPKWIEAMSKGDVVTINGDGETSRDFCYVDNVVQANILAAMVDIDDSPRSHIFNVAVGAQTTLNMLCQTLRASIPNVTSEVMYNDFRPGDVRHSKADISLISDKLGFVPSDDFESGISKTVNWFVGDKKNTDTRVALGGDDE